MKQTDIDRAVLDGIANAQDLMQKAQTDINPPRPVFSEQQRQALITRVGPDKAALVEQLLKQWRGGGNA